MNKIKVGMIVLALAFGLAACSPAVDNQVANVIEQKANQENAIAQKLYYEAVAESYVAQEAESKAKVTAAWSNSEISKAQTWQERWPLVVWLQITGWTLALIGAGWLVFSLINMQMRRMQLAYYGQHKNPLILAPNGAVYNPLTEGWSGDELPEGLREQLAAGFQALMLAQAQHPPNPAAVKPEVAKSFEWKAGPFGARTVRAPVVEKALAPAVPQVDPPKLEPGKDKMHLVFVEGSNMTQDEKKLFDLREMVEGAEVRGLTRAKWEGHKFATGNECTQGYHRELVEVLVAAQVVTEKGKTQIMRVSTDKAIEALGLQAYDYR